jgi:surface antigen
MLKKVFMMKNKRLKQIIILFILTSIVMILAPSKASLAQIAETWNTYRENRYGFTIQYPEAWQVAVTLTNNGKGSNVIEQRLLFNNGLAGVNIDVFPNHEGLDLATWYDKNQQHFMPENAIFQDNLNIAGQPAIYAFDPGDKDFPSRHTTIFAHDYYVFRIEYQATTGEDYLEVYQGMLTSLNFINGIDSLDQLFDLTDFPSQIYEIQDQNCCGYTDPNPNPYPCYDGNCTWWARYKRPDTGGQSIPYWGNASNWASRALEEGFIVNNTPVSGAIACWPSSNHVAYVKSYDGAIATMSDMDFTDHDCNVDEWNQTNFSGIQFIHPPNNDTTPPVISFNIPLENQWYKTNQTLSWTVSDAAGSGVDYFRWEWNDTSPDNRIASTNGSTTLSTAGQGQHTLYVQAWDKAGNPTSVQDRGWFGYDTFAPSNPTSVNSGCGVANNVWQNSCNDPNFSWSGASDPNGIGVKDYHYYWGTNPVGALTTFTSIASFNPSAVSGPVGVYYLRLATRDQLNQESSPSTLFVLRYDASQPTTSVRINNGSATTNQVNVWLDMTSADTGSGVDQVRISNNGTDWTTWQSYQDTLPWIIPALDRRDHTVYVQVKDKAGNISATASDEIRLDLYPVMPHSANYRICIDSLNAAGSADPSSNTYTLVSSIGQVWSNRATGNNLNEQSGFLADMDNCLPIEHAVGENYQVSNWVVAAGGGLRGSTNYTLGDTTGEAFASEESQFSSASYQLASGFWANVSLGIVGQPPPPTPTPLPVTPTPTATPGPTATPVPGGFGVSINSGDLYTNDAEVTVNLSAPNVTQMRLSNDGGYADEGWTTYQPITNWQITTFGNYVLPRLVYVWFKDADGIIYGTYFDDIIYDPVAPEGSVTVLGSNDSIVDLLLSAADDNSGVAQMRVSENANLSNVEWQTYEESISLELIGDTVYVQFRDAANNESPVYSTKVNTGLKEKVYLPMITR